MIPAGLSRLGVSTWLALVSVTALVVSAVGGFLITMWSWPTTTSRMLPWVAGRALGLAAYLALTALVLLGTWQRHPWRYRFKLLHPELRLGAHAALGLATIVLMLGHVLALVLDRYAGVGWRGALLPGAAHYRPGAVTIGVLAAYGMLAVTLTARFAGRLTGRHWLTVHRLGVPIFGAVWAHGLLAGTDTPALRWLYATTGLLVVSLLVSRFAARPTVLPTGVS